MEIISLKCGWGPQNLAPLRFLCRPIRLLRVWMTLRDVPRFPWKRHLLLPPHSPLSLPNTGQLASPQMGHAWSLFLAFLQVVPSSWNALVSVGQTPTHPSWPASRQSSLEALLSVPCTMPL